MSAIQDETNDFVRKAIKAMSKKYGVLAINTMIFIQPYFVGEDSIIVFKVAIDNGSGFRLITDVDSGTVKLFSFSQVLGRALGIDPILKIKEMIAMPFLEKLLKRISTDFSVEYKDINCRILTTDKEVENIFFLIYNKGNKVEQVDYKYIFSEE